MVFVYSIVPKLTARHFFFASFPICFSEKVQKYDVFLRKKAYF